MGIYALCYIYNLFGVMVFQRSILNWRRGIGSIWHGYMCIVLYMKLIWCNGFPEIYAWLEEGWGVNLPWVYVHCAIYEVCGVMVFQRSMLDWRRGQGQSGMGICALCDIWNLFGVMVFQRSMPVDLPSLVLQYSRHLCSIDWGVDLPVDLPSLA